MIDFYSWLCVKRIGKELGKKQMNNEQDYVVGWGTLALINAGLAQGKNRSGLNWFLLSMLIGPIATFVLVAFHEKLGSHKP